MQTLLSREGRYPFELVLGRCLVVVEWGPASGQIVMVEVALDLVHAVPAEAAQLRMVVRAQVTVRATRIESARLRQRLGRNGFVVLDRHHRRGWNENEREENSLKFFENYM